MFWKTKKHMTYIHRLLALEKVKILVFIFKS